MSVINGTIAVIGSVFNLFNWGSGADDNRWHPPMSDDVTKLGDFGTLESAMGDKDGDHPRSYRESVLGDEATGFIDTYKSTYNDVENIQIKK